MTQRVRQNVKAQIDQAIASGSAQPRAPRNGLGLVLPTGARFRTLFDKRELQRRVSIIMKHLEYHLLGSSTSNRMRYEKAEVNTLSF